MKFRNLLVVMALLTVGTATLVAPTAAAQAPGACVQANTFVFGMAHGCPLGFPQWPKPQSCHVNYYQSLVGERAGVLVWIC